MSTAQTDLDLLPHARALAERAGFDTSCLQPLHRGLSADLFTIHPDESSAPDAVVKLQRGFAGKAWAESAALAFLGEHDFANTPRLLLAEPNHEPPALVLSWLGAGRHARGVDFDALDAEHTESLGHELGRWLGRLHELRVPPGDVKMSSDPLALPDRLLTQAENAVDRFARRHADQTATGALLADALAWLTTNIPILLGAFDDRRLIHRDLRPDNILVCGPERQFCGVVDFEHTAAAHPAWDFAKLRWWIFDAHPALEVPFRAGYERERTWPHDELRRLFRIFEATTLIAYFFGRHEVYPDQAIWQLEADLRGKDRPRWTTTSR